MKLYRASARASVERELTRNLFPCQDDNNKNYTERQLVLQSRGILLGLCPNKRGQ